MFITNNKHINSFSQFQDKEVATLIENLYTKFKMYVTKYESPDTKEASQPLLSHLERINDFLVKRGTRFLTGN